MLMPDQQASELTKPCVGSLHDPTANIAPQFTSILVAPFLVVLPVGRNQFNPSLLQALTQRVGVVAAVGDHALRLLPRTAFPAWDPDFGECGFRKRNLTGGGNFQPNSQRKTLTVDQYHPLRPLAPLGFTDREARGRIGWYWSTVKVFRWEFGWKVPPPVKLRLRKPHSPKSGSHAGKAVRGKSRSA